MTPSTPGLNQELRHLAHAAFPAEKRLAINLSQACCSI